MLIICIKKCESLAMDSYNCYWNSYNQCIDRGSEFMNNENNSFIDAITYDESTNKVIYNNTNYDDCYTTFHGISVKSDGSICKNYIFANDVRDNELEQVGISYIIDS